MLSSIISGLFGALFNSVVGFLSSWLTKKDYQKQGAVAQAAKEEAATAKVEAAIAQTDASVDRSQSALADAADKGEF